MWCSQCARDEPVEHHNGTAVCAACGFVQEESQIVSDITFGENSAGGAVVQGAYVANDSRGARTQGPGGFRAGGSGESRESTLANAADGIRKLASAKGVPTSVADRAIRMFKLAIEGGAEVKDGEQPANFVLGRRSEYSQAACLYTACRHEKTNHMLIDFADVLGINVFVLGRSYLRLVRCLGIKMPIVDPSIYIGRFASMLDFGDDTSRVAQDATRLVKRFKEDWLIEGRRPAGISGACLLLAARMNGFRRSITEIIQVVKIADVTLRTRLEEFAGTESGKLSVESFKTMWLESETEPPSLKASRRPKREPRMKGDTKRNLEKRKRDAIKLEILRQGGKLDAKDEEASDEGDDEAEGDDEQRGKGVAAPRTPSPPPLDPEIDAMADAAVEAEMQRHLREDVGQELDAQLLAEEEARAARAKAGEVARANVGGTVDTHAEAGPSNSARRSPSARPSPVAGEAGAPGGEDDEDAPLPESSIAVVKRNMSVAPAPGDPLAGLDEAELDNFILTPDEARIKERVWMEFNKDYLELSLERQLKLEADIRDGIAPKTSNKRKRNKPRDSSTAAASAFEATRQMLQAKKTVSKKLNYDSISSIFEKPKKRKKKNTSDGAREGATHGDGSAYFASDTERSEPEVVEEDGQVLPSSHPDVRQKSRADKKRLQKGKGRSASRGSATDMSSAGEESEGNNAVGATDAQTDGEGNDTDGDELGNDWRKQLGLAEHVVEEEAEAYWDE